MKREIMKRVVIAGVALLSVPAFALAQDKKGDENKKVQTIVITRESNTDGKTVIEIDGDKIKVNGKDAKDSKDVHVNVNTIASGANFYKMFNNMNGRTWNFDMDGDHMQLFNEDENRAMLGVTTESDDKGAMVKTVNENSAASKAGLKKGDIITKIGSKKIEEADDVSEAVRSHKPGEKVDITYLREGKEQKATAELTKWRGVRMNTNFTPRVPMTHVTPPNVNVDVAPFEGYNSVIWAGRPKLGLSIQDTEDGKGVKVLEVDDESNAAKAGIKKDDVILAIDDKEVKGTEDVTRTIRSSRDKISYNFKVSRGGKTQNIEVKYPRKLKTADL